MIIFIPVGLVVGLCLPPVPLAPPGAPGCSWCPGAGLAPGGGCYHLSPAKWQVAVSDTAPVLIGGLAVPGSAPAQLAKCKQ